MSLDHVGDFPRLRGMTSQTVGTEFRFVDVRVAGGTSIARPRELQILVTTCAGDSLMLSFQDKSCLRMVETCIRPHLPGVGRMTRLARNLDIAVG